MKNLILATLAGGLLVLGLVMVTAPQPTYAAGFDEVCNTGSGAANSTVCKSKGEKTNPITGPTGIFIRIIELFNAVVAIAAVFVIAISGIRFIFSSGDPQAVAGARNAILYSVVGLIVALVAQSIVFLVVNKL